MAQAFPEFHDILRNVEMGLARVDLPIPRRYADLVLDARLAGRVLGQIVDEFERTRRWIPRLTGLRALLDRNPVLARSVRLRNPHVDPLSPIQVDLLRRRRAGEAGDDLDHALAVTIHGIAAGLRNAG